MEVRIRMINEDEELEVCSKEVNTLPELIEFCNYVRALFKGEKIG